MSRFGELWNRLVSEPDRVDPFEMVRSFVESGDVADLTRVLPLALSPVPEVAGEAAAAIDRYMAAVQPSALAALDEAVRWISFGWGAPPSPWHSLSPRDVADLFETGLHGASVLGVASFHPNGRVREAAVKQLARLTDGSELPFLLIRLNDWAAPVRDTAYSQVKVRLTTAYAPHLVRNLRLVLRLEWCGRADHEALVDEVVQVLRDPDSRSALREGARSPDRWLRRTCNRLLLEHPGGDTREILERALGDEDAFIRHWAARQADRFLDGEPLRRVVGKLLRDPFVGTRREGLRMLVDRFPGDAEADLRRSLLDRHATIREIARVDLKQRGVKDFRGFYRSVVERARGPELRAALSGLGETGTTEDAALVERHLGNPVPGVRRAAVLALTRLAPEAALPGFLEALQDGNAGVSRAAMLALAGHASRAGAARLAAIAEESRYVHVRINTLSLLARLGKWEGIPWLIRAGSSEDPRVAQVARQHLLRWMQRFNRSSTHPTKAQLEWIAAELDRAGAALPVEQERALRFYMKGY